MWRNFYNLNKVHHSCSIQLGKFTCFLWNMKVLHHVSLTTMFSFIITEMYCCYSFTNVCTYLVIRCLRSVMLNPPVRHFLKLMSRCDVESTWMKGAKNDFILYRNKAFRETNEQHDVSCDIGLGTATHSELMMKRLRKHLEAWNPLVCIWYLGTIIYMYRLQKKLS